MKLQDKKLNMADKMYTMNSKGSNRTSPKYVMKGADSKFDKYGEMGYQQADAGKGAHVMYKLSKMAGGEGKFEGKYNQ
jgi:hypothetical protein